MQSSLYVTLSAQQNLQRQLDSIANNVANITTAGYRGNEIKFDALVSQNTPEPVAFAGKSKEYLSIKQGELMKTGNPFDVAIQGKPGNPLDPTAPKVTAWFGITTPTGTVYTRDGRFRVSPNGELQTLNGYPVQDSGGGNIQLTANGGTPVIGANGTITQGENRVGAIGLFQIEDNATLIRADNSGVIPDPAATPVIDFARTGIVQGYSEQSNVNPVSEMSRLIYVQRAFEAVTGLMSSNEASLTDAIKSLGSTS